MQMEQKQLEQQGMAKSGNIYIHFSLYFSLLAKVVLMFQK
jgi:hypothetical protein